ncbi:MAG: hypothetical protein A2X31_13210 [Elusimicrobia bacterium GWB2_63_22]|nr:MAG: hypothetical protein A2X31_13210 [Elusimicrobia bacterium GWB2_63_22]
MKTVLAILSGLLLAAPCAARAGAFDELSGDGGADIPSVSAPEPVSAAAEEAEVTDQTLRADFDFLVRPDAVHEPGAELFDPAELVMEGRGSEKAAGGGIPYLALARAEAKAQGIDLALVLAVIQKESSFNPNAKSPVGARGLMQLMPSTAKWMGLKDAKKIIDPAVNIKYGVKYLKYLWDEFATIPAGDLSAEDIKQKTSQMAIAAYNAGQGNVHKYNDVPPFKETRSYVKKVTEYFSNYKTLLQGPAAP